MPSSLLRTGAAQQSCAPGTALGSTFERIKIFSAANKRIVARICIQLVLQAFQNPSKMIPKSLQIVPTIVQIRGLEEVWGCFVACLRPKAPVDRFLDGSRAALGRLLAHLGRLLGASWAPGWGAQWQLGRSFTRKWSQVGRKI